VTWENPTAVQRQQILRATRTVAVVGASPNPARASNFVATYLLASTDYDVYFVNPNAIEILGGPQEPRRAAGGARPRALSGARPSGAYWTWVHFLSHGGWIKGRPEEFGLRGRPASSGHRSVLDGIAMSGLWPSNSRHGLPFAPSSDGPPATMREKSRA
jgi:hypothetical protein